MISTRRKRSLRILVIEDNPFIAMDLELQIEEFGHISLGRHGRSLPALEAAQTLHPDAALVDLNLADGRTGIFVAQRLKQMGVQCIIISAEVHHHAASTQAHTVLEKPVHSGLLRSALDRIMAETSI